MILMTPLFAKVRAKMLADSGKDEVVSSCLPVSQFSLAVRSRARRTFIRRGIYHFDPRPLLINSRRPIRLRTGHGWTALSRFWRTLQDSIWRVLMAGLTHGNPLFEPVFPPSLFVIVAGCSGLSREGQKRAFRQVELVTTPPPSTP